jgi:prevent-host-death family protein
MTYGLREANQQFARVIREVRAGREVVLTERGRPLAVIRLVSEAVDEQARLDVLAAEGLVTPPAESGPMSAPRWKPVAPADASISETVDRDRDESA